MDVVVVVVAVVLGLGDTLFLIVVDLESVGSQNRIITPE